MPAARLADELARLAPAECLCAESDADALGAIAAALPLPPRR